MSHKSARVAEMILLHQGRSTGAHLLGFVACFNRGQFYEAHDVLEDLWLDRRRSQDGAFYKGLIQLAGAFVHLQKDRLAPASSLLKLARTYLENYPAVHLGLELPLEMIDDWLGKLKQGGSRINPLRADSAPQLRLLPESK